MSEFKDRLKQLREAASMTQEGLARAADLSTSAVSKLEQGGIDPAWSTVQRLAKALGLGVEAFADQPEPPPAPEAPPAPKKGRKPKGK